MANQNGVLILKTLEDLKEPVTITTIATKIANEAGATLKDVRDTVKATLDGGVQYGFVQKRGRKYFTAAQLEEDGGEQTADNVADTMEDRAGGRRRRSSRHASRKSRSASRKSRSASRSSSRGSRGGKRRRSSRRGGR